MNAPEIGIVAPAPVPAPAAGTPSPSAHAQGELAKAPKRGIAAVAAVAFAAVMVCAPLARAQAKGNPTKGDEAAAEELFKAARALVKAGNYAEGCPKFKESLALHASASTMLNIALCHEHEGKVATAREDYNRALSLNRETEGEQRRKALDALANEGIAKLEPRLPRLGVVVKDPPKGLSVLRDGKEIPPAALGEALPADPGPHEIRASAPGHKAVSRSVTLEEGKTVNVELKLEPEAAAPPPSRAPVWPWISGAAGVALVGVSIYFLVDDLSTISRLQENCQVVSLGTYCKPGYDYAADNARKNRDLGLFIGLSGAGAVALGAAIVGLAVGGAPEEADEKAMVVPLIAPGAAGAFVVGRF